MHLHKPALDPTQASISLAKTHYENFPVASILLPKALRVPVSLIYSFARQADDFADEGDLSVAQRLNGLQDFQDELDLIQAYIKPKTLFFNALGQMIRTEKLPLAPFFDLLSAFRQDVTKTRYANFNEVLDYCRRSANPVGRLMLHLYRADNPKNIVYADSICTALQLINFLQDIAIDFQKNDGKQRIYLCQDELEKFGVNEQDMAQQSDSEPWRKLMALNINRAAQLLQNGKPLGRILTGRIGFNMRMMIAGGERILEKLKRCQGDVFRHRPTLNAWDWLVMLVRAL